MAFDSQFLDELKSRHTLSDLVGRKVKLVRRGKEFSGLCPFHNEKTPSFTVNDQKGFYHCFGCGAHGGVIDFVIETEGLSFLEAIEQLAGQAGMDVPKPSRETRERAEKRQSLSEVMAVVADWYQAQLVSGAGKAALGYLTGRGLDQKTIKKYQIGYAPGGHARGGRTFMKDAMLARGVRENALVETGMLIKPEGGGESYDRFRERVMFPILDRKGQIIAFGGRALSSDAKAKYLNSPETVLFHKGATLYNWARARKAAFDVGTVLVVEGYMDVIALGQFGLDHAVAPLGTALTEDQISHLWQMSDEPLLAFDGDKAGLRAASRAVGRALPLLKPGKSLRFMIMPDGDDPDTLVRNQGKDALYRLMDQAMPLVDLLWQGLIENAPIDTPERQAGLEKKVFGELRSIEDEKVQALYQREFKNRMWDLLRAGRSQPHGSAHYRSGKQYGSEGQNKIFKGARPQSGRSGLRLTPLGRTAGASPVISGLEKLMLMCLIHHPEILVRHSEIVASLELSDDGLVKLRDSLLEITMISVPLDEHHVFTHLKSQGFETNILRLKKDLPRQANWSAWPDAALSDALTLFEHVLARYRFATEARKDYEQARVDYEENVTEENHARFMAAQQAFRELEENHASIDGYGLESNKFREG